ncbi:MAG: SMC family ATPase, partial [Solirubrobacteraceae bacterium]
MRPLELRITGLRSYRADTIVDFTELNLLAIIGATGSGKSSLLEAITYALYGCATWGGKSTKALIADGAISMTVSLSFLADGQQWLITRKASRGVYPPSSQELRCLSDPERPKIDGSSDITTRIIELIGLGYEGFKSCVLLPQGRFDQLLKATAADRVGILKGILGLEALNTTRTRAQELGEVVSDRLDDLRKARSAFLQDPRATYEAAAARIATLTPRVARLEDLEQRVQALVEEVRGYQVACKTATEAAGRLSELVDTELVDRLRVLEALEAELTTIREDAATAAEAAERKALAASQAVADAKRDGRDAAAITGLRGTVSAATADLAAVADARTQLAGKRAQLATDDKALADDVERATQLARGRDETAQAEQDAETAAKQARADATAVIARIETIVIARATLARSEKDLEDLLTRSELAHRQSEAALTQQQEAEVALKQAQTSLDDAHRADAAARAAHGCEPGDNCPVCSQQLPDTFQIPETSADLAALQLALERAQQAERSALTALTKLRAAATQASGQAAVATTIRDNAKAAWTELVATPLPGHLRHDTVVADAATIAALNDPAERAAQRYQAARRASKKASDAHQAATAAISATEKALARRAQELSSEKESIDRREQSMRSKLNLLPDWVGAPAAANLADLAACDERLAAALGEAETREQLAATTAEISRDRHRKLLAVKERIQTELHGPASSERNTIRALSAEANRHRDHPLPAAAPAAANLTELLAWGEHVVASADETLLALQATAKREDARAQAKKTGGVSLLKAAGFETSDELRKEVINAAGELKYATSEHQRAAAQLEPVARLDDLISKAEQLRGGLRELAFQLGDGKFVGFVVEQRQQALLALASGIVGEVTGGRYGFTKDFDIVDRQTNASRTPDTLSGGETFLVSLALALGLVELADRSGGRLQALFLDEGFGSLDPDALDQALSALERRAEAGRLIAMISHVPAIAERIEQVLQVTKTPQGSEVRLLTEDERAA